MVLFLGNGQGLLPATECRVQSPERGPNTNAETAGASCPSKDMGLWERADVCPGATLCLPGTSELTRQGSGDGQAAARRVTRLIQMLGLDIHQVYHSISSISRDHCKWSPGSLIAGNSDVISPSEDVWLPRCRVQGIPSREAASQGRLVLPSSTGSFGREVEPTRAVRSGCHERGIDIPEAAQVLHSGLGQWKAESFRRELGQRQGSYPKGVCALAGVLAIERKASGACRTWPQCSSAEECHGARRCSHCRSG